MTQFFIILAGCINLHTPQYYPTWPNWTTHGLIGHTFLDLGPNKNTNSSYRTIIMILTSAAPWLTSNKTALPTRLKIRATPHRVARRAVVHRVPSPLQIG